jgi:hypothetical protein
MKIIITLRYSFQEQVVVMEEVEALAERKVLIHDPAIQAGMGEKVEEEVVVDCLILL